MASKILRNSQIFNFILISVTIICTFLNLFLFVQANNPRTNKDLQKETMFVYPEGIWNETQVPLCETPTTPCNYIQNLFFFPFKITRLCKCPHQIVCPFDYEIKRKYDTVFLNNREQIKFCHDLDKCTGSTEAILEIGNDGYPTELNCFCPRKRHWQKLNGSENKNKFKCEKMKPCETTSSICGNVREDTYASYFNCSCPPNQLCMPFKKIQRFEEVSYKGAGFISKCGIP